MFGLGWKGCLPEDISKPHSTSHYIPKIHQTDAGLSRRKLHPTKNISPTGTARVINEFLVSSWKRWSRWYLLEMIKLVFKCSRQAASTPLGHSGKACPPPHRCGLAADCSLSALRSMHFKLICQLPCKPLPLSFPSGPQVPRL